MLIFIDNYDSFTYNIVQYFQVLKQSVQVYKNDHITVQEVLQLQPKAIIIGPGPCYPHQAGISIDLIIQATGHIPILGICLGHQAIGQAFGATVIRAPNIMHGRVSQMYHNHTDVFMDIVSPFNATRYHSLLLDTSTLPSCLEITAWTQDSEVMAIRHTDHLVQGMQFHPESILTEHGYQLLSNFLALIEHRDKSLNIV